MGGHKGLQCLGPHSAVARAEACRCRAHVQRGDVRATASARSLRGQQGGPGFRLGARGGPPALAARSCGQIPRMHRRTQSSVLALAGTLLACEIDAVDRLIFVPLAGCALRTASSHKCMPGASRASVPLRVA
mmetsp:Transcript_108177/g.336285  ORF Transcript_108177/g.336285 Transcript_108177/m.336285 type:complete len:132 (+) Transcript_108177:520-915(+)